MWAYTLLIYAVSVVVVGAGVYIAFAGTRFFLNDDEHDGT